MSPLEAQVALNMLPGIGPIRCRRLLNHLGSAEQVLNAGRNAWLEVKGIGPELAHTLQHWQDLCDPTKEIDECRSRGIALMTPQSSSYPSFLREAFDAPLILYVMGQVRDCDHQALSIVGSRRCSHYGLQATRKLSYQLAAGGHTIVSGLARGIDTAAHEAALAAEGRTIAVIGSGLAHLYPSENEVLAERISSGNGAVISEYPLHTRPDKHTFPMRNRIIAAWSHATIVVECPDKSGALITANLATEYGRSVFVLPGPIDHHHFDGSHRLIREGATLITDASHVIEDLGGAMGSFPTAMDIGRPDDHGMPEDQSKILGVLGSSEMTTDELIQNCGIPVAAVTRSLAMLEIQGFIKSRPGSRYVRI